MNTIEKNIITTRIERKFIICNHCDVTTTIDIEAVVFEPCTYAPVGVDYYRIDGESKVAVESNTIKDCPHCHAKNIVRKQLKKVKQSHKHVCDDKCQAATSESCTCSCGGKNHGIKNKVVGSLFF